MELAIKSGKHPDRALSAAFVRSAKTPGRYADGNGLYLLVDKSGARRWVLRTVVQGRRRDIGLGGVSLVSLAEARERAVELRRVAREGGDPIAGRAAKREIPTFLEAARQVHKQNVAAWRNAKHAAQWLTTLSTYAFPVIGDLRVDQVNTPAVLSVLQPIWLAKPETARRVRQRIGAVLDWAKAAGFYPGENPTRTVTLGLPKQPKRDRHHAALPYAQLPEFMAMLRVCELNVVTRKAFEFLILTATRTREVIQAQWSEIDLEERVWTIGAERMKTGQEHRVPLAHEALALLNQIRDLGLQSMFVFPGQALDRGLSDMAFLMVLRRMKVAVTAHGFRSTFRDWAAEETSFPREVCEMALAHQIESRVEAAYRRGDLFEKRRDLMAAWAWYATNHPSNPA